MKNILLALLLLPVAACVPTTAGPPQLGEREAADLARALDGKVAGAPVSCVPANRGTDLRALGDNTLIYRVNRNLVYRNTLAGACNGLSMGDAMVLDRVASQYCRGDIARVVNLQSGFQTGSCSLGDFVPYRTPGTEPRR